MASATSTSTSSTSKKAQQEQIQQAVFEAATDGDRPRLLALLRGAAAAASSVDLNSKHNWFGQTALHAAVIHHHAGCASDLAKAGANVDATDLQYGYTPLYRAAQSGCQGCVSLLLKAGAKLGAVASDGNTPLFLAQRSGHSGVVAMLQGESRWRRRRALALIREQREAGSDWGKARKEWGHSSAM